MPTFIYYATFEESWAMLEDIYFRGDIAAVELNEYFPAPDAAPRYTTPDSDLKVRLGTKLTAALLLLGNYSPFPPRLKLLDREDMPNHYYVTPLSGGPGIEFHFARLREDPPMAGLLQDGDIQRHDSYGDPSGNWSPASEAVREAYYDFQHRMKRHLTRYPLAGSSHRVWIGHMALAKLKAGEAWIMKGDKHYTAGQWFDGRRPSHLPPFADEVGESVQGEQVLARIPGAQAGER